MSEPEQGLMPCQSCHIDGQCHQCPGASLLSGRRPDTTQMWNFVGGFRATPGAVAWKTWPEWARTHGYTGPAARLLLPLLLLRLPPAHSGFLRDSLHSLRHSRAHVLCAVC